MILKNNSTISDDDLKPLLEFASRGISTVGCEVHVKASTQGRYRGMFYQGIPQIARTSRRARTLITMSFPKHERQYATKFDNTYRLKRIDAKFPDGFPFDNWRDVVIYLAAHEFRHLWQWQRTLRGIAQKKGKRLSGKGEYDAELFALRRLNAWRERTGRPAIPEAKQPNPFLQTPVTP